MKILIIALKEIKQNLRDKQGMAMMIALPIVLMLILGTALSGGMDENSYLFNNTKIVYSIEGKGQRVEAFEKFLNETKELGIKPTRVQDYKSGINTVKETEYVCYIYFNESENKINI